MKGHDRLTPEGKKFYAEVKKLAANEVFIGFQAGKKQHEGRDGEKADVAQIAAFNEFGTSTMPARPFLRKSADENKDVIVKMCTQAAKAIAKGSTEQQELKKLGVFGASLVQEKIESGSYVPLAPSTIKRKGSSKPLIDTGQMRQSVHYVIRRKED